MIWFEYKKQGLLRKGDEADCLIIEPGGIIPPLRQQSATLPDRLRVTSVPSPATCLTVQPDTLSLCKTLAQYTVYELQLNWEKQFCCPQKRFPGSKWPRYAFAASPDPAGGAYLAGLRGPTSRGGKGKGNASPLQGRQKGLTRRFY